MTDSLRMHGVTHGALIPGREGKGRERGREGIRTKSKTSSSSSLTYREGGDGA